MIAPFGSSTASTISESALTAATVFHAEIIKSTSSRGEPHAMCDAALAIFHEMRAILRLSEGDRIELYPSGTDAVEGAARAMARKRGYRIVAVVPQLSETGSGVHAALQRGGIVELRAVALRSNNGTLRSPDVVDGDFSGEVATIRRQGDTPLVVLTDTSKSGLIAPSIESTLNLVRGGGVEVIVDACQARLSRQTLNAYLDLGWTVAITGSKFWSGPSFSGALIWRQAGAVRRPGANAMQGARIGVLLRWKAALTEAAPFFELADEVIEQKLLTFGEQVLKHTQAQETIRLESGPRMNRAALGQKPSWDLVPTIFSIVPQVEDASGRLQHLDSVACRRIHERLAKGQGRGGSAAAPTELGQPVALGMRNGAEFAALRICSSARLISDSAKSDSAERVIADRLCATVEQIGRAVAATAGAKG